MISRKVAEGIEPPVKISPAWIKTPRELRDDAKRAEQEMAGGKRPLEQGEVASLPALVGRVSFTGELGYEMWVTSDYQRAMPDYEAYITRYGSPA